MRTHFLRTASDKIQLENTLNWSNPMSDEEIAVQARILLYFLYSCIPARVVKLALEMFGANNDDFSRYTTKEFGAYGDGI